MEKEREKEREEERGKGREGKPEEGSKKRREREKGNGNKSKEGSESDNDVDVLMQADNKSDTDSQLNETLLRQFSLASSSSPSSLSSSFSPSLSSSSSSFSSSSSSSSSSSALLFPSSSPSTDPCDEDLADYNELRKNPITDVAAEFAAIPTAIVGDPAALPQSFLPGLLHYNNKNKTGLIQPRELERRFLQRPWPFINEITSNYLVKNIYPNNSPAREQITSIQPNYINYSQKFPTGFEELFKKNPIDFFLKLSSSSVFKYFGDFHSRLQHTCVSETPAERKIKHAKRMITKYRYTTHANTVVSYMKASSRKDMK
jgi:hypothetical protein